MGWAVQHMRVTLEDAATGEVVVIEEGQAANDAKAKEAKAAKAAEEAKAREAKAKKEAKAKDDEARAKEAKAKEERAKAKAKEEAKAKETKEKEAKPKSKPRSSKKPALAWRAVKDNNYDGFAAKVRPGEFKALHARNTQWALFFERKDTYPAHLGCFSKLEHAKARAQELHDAGWPESEFGDVTREMIERACPVPVYEREPEPKRAEPEKPAKPPKAPKAPKAAETPQMDKPAPPSPSPEQKSTDELLSRSFIDQVRALADEDEDDD